MEEEAKAKVKAKAQVYGSYCGMDTYGYNVVLVHVQSNLKE